MTKINSKSEDSPNIENHHIDDIDWDPIEAKKAGSLKGTAEYKVDIEYNESDSKIIFTEPKRKKKTVSVTKVVNLKKNKNSLF